MTQKNLIKLAQCSHELVGLFGLDLDNEDDYKAQATDKHLEKGNGVSLRIDTSYVEIY